MAEYIEREALLNALCTDMCEIKYKGVCVHCREAELIRAFPAADVVPMKYHERCLEIEIQKRLAIEPKHGRWIPCDPDSDVRFYCSECGTEISTSWDYDCDEMWNGCPHCLARMDGDG